MAQSAAFQVNGASALAKRYYDTAQALRKRVQAKLDAGLPVEPEVLDIPVREDDYTVSVKPPRLLPVKNRKSLEVVHTGKREITFEDE